MKFIWCSILGGNTALGMSFNTRLDPTPLFPNKISLIQPQLAPVWRLLANRVFELMAALKDDET